MRLILEELGWRVLYLGLMSRLKRLAGNSSNGGLNWWRFRSCRR
ncbi:hypothetical protein [Rhodothermus marinus]|nr:hypothetical protein [Rhodothermus marinus]